MHIQPLEQRRLLAASVEFALIDADSHEPIAVLSEGLRLSADDFDGPAYLRATPQDMPGSVDAITGNVGGTFARIWTSEAPFRSPDMLWESWDPELTGEWTVTGTVRMEGDMLWRIPSVNFSVEPVSARPGPDNTGHEGELEPWTGPSRITTPGVYSDFFYSGNLRVAADNVTLSNFEVRGNGKAGTAALYIESGYENVLVTHGTIWNGGASIVTIKSGTIQYSELHTSLADGIGWGGQNVTAQFNWIHHPLGTMDGAHADGIQVAVAQNARIIGNNIDMPKGVPGTRSNAAIMAKSSSNVINGLLIQDNWMSGGNFTMYVENGTKGDPTNVRIIGNTFARKPDYTYGLLQKDGSPYIGTVGDEMNRWQDGVQALDANGKTVND